MTTAARAYLDWNASALLRPEARAAMVAALDRAANPSAVHAEGRAAREIVERAREDIAALAGCSRADVVLTSGATEALATVIAQRWPAVVTSGIEHAAVLEPARRSGAEMIDVAVTPSGLIDAAAFARACERAGPGGLAAIQLANNETGVLQPVPTLAAIAHAHGLRVMVDAAQAAGRIAISVAALGADYLVLSGHKLGAPHGTGALVLGRGVEIAPLIAGGGQELRRRAGTEAVAAIAGFGAAARASRSSLDEEAAHMTELRARLERGLYAAVPGVRIIGAEAPRLPNTTCAVIAGHAAETLLIRLDLAGVAVSSGSACSSGKVGTSHVLIAMGIPTAMARSAIRISTGPTTTTASIDRILGELERITAGGRDTRAVA